MTIQINKIVTLDSVATNATGSAVPTSNYDKSSVFVNVTAPSGTATITIQASPDNSSWYTLDNKVYTAETTSDVYSYEGFFPFMRTNSSTMDTATAVITIASRGLN